MSRIHLLVLIQLLKRKLSKELNLWSRLAARLPNKHDFAINYQFFNGLHAPSTPKLTHAPTPSTSPKPGSQGFFSVVRQSLTEKAKKTHRFKQDVGTRLYKQAEFLAHKKQVLKQTLQVTYPFKPQLVSNTSKWLRSHCPPTTDEVAVVSGTNSTKATFYSLT